MNTKPKTLSHSAETTKLRLDVHNSLTEFSAEQAAQWDALVQDNNPFLKHGFLSALEAHGCVGEHFGWLPHHLTLTHESPDGDQIVAALPLYEKHNNYGEFVFDQAWEQAWNHVGLPYYPKLVSAVPYTPAQGQRFLIHSQPETIGHGLFDAEQLQTQLFDNALALAEELNMSGVHWLFANPEQQAWLESHKRDNEYFRHDCQFHWFNQDYQTFDDFLAQLKKKSARTSARNAKPSPKAASNFVNSTATPPPKTIGTTSVISTRKPLSTNGAPPRSTSTSLKPSPKPCPSKFCWCWPIWTAAALPEP